MYDWTWAMIAKAGIDADSVLVEEQPDETVTVTRLARDSQVSFGPCMRDDQGRLLEEADGWDWTASYNDPEHGWSCTESGWGGDGDLAAALERNLTA